MSMAVITSVKGAPGVSTIAYELVARYPRAVVGFEADVSGGSWAFTYGLSHDPGLLSLAASREELRWDHIARHGHRLGEHGLVVCSAPGRDTATAVAVLEPRLHGFSSELDVVLDVGRLHDGVMSLCRIADLVVVAARPSTADVASLRRECDALVHLGCRVNVVLVGDQPHSRAEVAEFVGVPVLEGVIPFDPISIQRLLSTGRSKRFDRAFNRVTREIADKVALGPVHDSVGS